MQYRYAKIDAFAHKNSRGNPAACLYLAEGQSLSDAAMLDIAQEHKGFVSEVVYCTPGEDGGFSLRYFSSECEVAFCGHGTIACMHYLLAADSALSGIKELSIHTPRGTLTVYNDIAELDAVFISAPDPVHEPAAPGADLIAQALGTETATLGSGLPVRVINSGLQTLIVPMRSLDAALALLPDERTLKTFCLAHGIDIVLTFSTEVSDPVNALRTRVFAPKFGYLEDTATGSGNAAMGCYMLQQNLWAGNPIAIEQNGERQAYNLVRLKTLGGRVLFGGGGIAKIEGLWRTGLATA